jgi:site-specific DNA-cytosine methylase
MKKIKVLSLFDGMSVAQQALKEVGMSIEQYYASETDSYAIAVTQGNFPNTIQLGSVVGLSVDFRPDLMIGGSPCQDLSIAKKNREGLKGTRSGLFWEYVRIRDEVKPKYFILENVASMPKEARGTITEALGIEPVMINASLVSAQNRKRLFWISSRLDLCYNCKYEQLLNEIQHGGETSKTQRTGVEKLLQEESKEENKVQDLRQRVFSQELHTEMLLGELYEHQQKAERQETEPKKERLPKEILQEKKERIVGVWQKLSPEQQKEFSKILQKILFQTRSKNEEGTERGVEKGQENYQYDWERGIVGYVEKDKHGMFVLRFYGGLNGRPHNPSEQGWDERFGELTTTLSELQFMQKGQNNICSCCGGITPIKYEQVEIPQPEDRGIILKDILEENVNVKYYVKGVDVSKRIGSLNFGGQGDRICSQEGKSILLSANGGGGGAKTGLYAVVSNYNRTLNFDKTNTLGSNSQCQTAKTGQGVLDLKKNTVRKLTPTECLRLQSMPDDYFDKATHKGKPISDSQKYKMCGNAFNSEIIKHILKQIQWSQQKKYIQN